MSSILHTQNMHCGKLGHRILYLPTNTSKDTHEIKLKLNIGVTPSVKKKEKKVCFGLFRRYPKVDALRLKKEFTDFETLSCY